jgi:hypothetical protein
MERYMSFEHLKGNSTLSSPRNKTSVNSEYQILKFIELLKASEVESRNSRKNRMKTGPYSK